jgi:vacuolar-type H+-ATPase subunit I/STV1
VILLGGSLFGQKSDAQVGTEQDQEENQEQVQEQIQIQLGPLADELQQLRLSYREQVQVLLEERKNLIRQYWLATEEEKIAVLRQLREHQKTIAETHRQLRREMRDQIRQIRAERRKRIENPGG